MSAILCKKNSLTFCLIFQSILWKLHRIWGKAIFFFLNLISYKKKITRWRVLIRRQHTEDILAWFRSLWQHEAYFYGIRVGVLVHILHHFCVNMPLMPTLFISGGVTKKYRPIKLCHYCYLFCLSLYQYFSCYTTASSAVPRLYPSFRLQFLMKQGLTSEYCFGELCHYIWFILV